MATSAEIITTLHKQVDEQAALLEKIRSAATQYTRCCDLWQDSLGGMHCRTCAQKTFAMMRDIQQLLGVDKCCLRLTGDR